MNLSFWIHWLGHSWCQKLLHSANHVPQWVVEFNIDSFIGGWGGLSPRGCPTGKSFRFVRACVRTHAKSRTGLLTAKAPSDRYCSFSRARRFLSFCFWSFWFLSFCFLPFCLSVFCPFAFWLFVFLIAFCLLFFCLKKTHTPNSYHASRGLIAALLAWRRPLSMINKLTRVQDPCSVWCPLRFSGSSLPSQRKSTSGPFIKGCWGTANLLECCSLLRHQKSHWRRKWHRFCENGFPSNHRADSYVVERWY